MHKEAVQSQVQAHEGLPHEMALVCTHIWNLLLLSTNPRSTCRPTLQLIAYSGGRGPLAHPELCAVRFVAVLLLPVYSLRHRHHVPPKDSSMQVPVWVTLPGEPCAAGLAWLPAGWA